MDLKTKYVHLKIIHKTFWTPGMVLQWEWGGNSKKMGIKIEQNGDRE